MQCEIIVGEDSEERFNPADESAEVWEAGGYGQSDLPQWGVGALQSTITILQRLHLRECVTRYATYY